LLSLLRGDVKIDELTVKSPALEIVRQADGTSNLDPLTRKSPKKLGKKGGTKARQPKKTGEPPQMMISRFKVENANIRLVSVEPGQSGITEFSKINLSIEQLGNNQKGQLVLSGLAKQVTKSALPEGPTGLAEATISGKFDFTLNAGLQPVELKGSTIFDVGKAEGRLAELLLMKLIVQAEVTPTEVREIALRFEKGGQPLGQARLTGPFNFAQSEGQLTLEIFSIDRQVLNLAGARHGWDFNKSLLNSTNQLTVSKKRRELRGPGLFGHHSVCYISRSCSKPAG